MMNCEYHEIAEKITLEDYDTLLYMIGMDVSKDAYVRFIVKKDEHIISSDQDNIDRFNRLLNNGIVKIHWINED